MRERKTLDRVISRAGAMSRSQAAEVIRAGRVRVNGLRVLDPTTWVDSGQDRVALDDAPLDDTRHVYLALHKPTGYVTTRKDERGRATVYEFLRDVGVWVAPVGRLDRDTSGLLLFTNDSVWADGVTDPHSKLAKTYECVAAGELADAALEPLRRGLQLADGPARALHVKHMGCERAVTRLELTITEGRNRQVRRMVEALGSRVIALRRTAIGPVKLGALAEGRHRALSSREVRSLTVA